MDQSTPAPSGRSAEATLKAIERSREQGKGTKPRHRPAPSPPPPQIGRSRDSASKFCGLCREAVKPDAQTCPHCQATRRQGGLKWISHREGRKRDIVIAALCAWLLAFGIGVVLMLVLTSAGAFKSSTTTGYTPATRCSSSSLYC